MTWRDLLTLTLLLGLVLGLAPLWIYGARQIQMLSYLKSSPGATTDEALIARFGAHPATRIVGAASAFTGIVLTAVSAVAIVRFRRADPESPVYRRPLAGLLSRGVGALTAVVGVALTVWALAIGPVTETMRFIQMFTVVPLAMGGLVVGLALSVVGHLLDANRRPALYGLWFSIVAGPIAGAVYFAITRALVVLLVLLTFDVAIAQDAWNVGDTVRAKSGAWFEAVIVEVKDGRYRIRWTTSKVPEGEWFDASRICSTKSPVLTSGEGCPAGFSTPGGGTVKAPPPAAKAPEAPAGVGVGKAGPLMTQQEILGFIEARIGAGDPFQNPKRHEIVAELVRMIRARGVDFTYDPLSEFSNRLMKLADTERRVTNAVAVNYGAPVAQPWLIGTWDLTKVGAAVDFVRDKKVYRQTEAGALVGNIVIAKDGTYTWNAPGQKITGKWRPATDAEMRLQGGAGLVLLKAKTGYDWLVSKSTNVAFKSDSIDIVEINSRQIREFGGRR